MSDVDLDAYLARIGYSGPREPTLDTLRSLHRLHPAAIPFEAVDVLLGRGVDLDPRAVDAKLITGGRGGYCFEQNSLFRRALQALGFQVDGLIARPRWNRPLDVFGPRTHMALRVRLEGGEWLADVGFGGCMLTTPVRMEVCEPQETWCEPVRLTPVAGELRLEVLLGDAWTPVYDLDLRPQLDIDFVGPNWYTSTHPDSIFRRTLMAARTAPDARHALLENRLTVRRPGAETERRSLNAAELERVLAEDFGLPVTADWRPALERAVVAGAQG